MRVKFGTYNAASVTSGDIATGLTKVLFYSLQSAGSATAPYASESSGTLSLTTASSDTGVWFAFGK